MALKSALSATTRAEDKKLLLSSFNEYLLEQNSCLTTEMNKMQDRHAHSLKELEASRPKVFWDDKYLLAAANDRKEAATAKKEEATRNRDAAT